MSCEYDRHVSYVHKPFFYLNRFVKLKPRTHRSDNIGQLLLQEHLVVKDYAVADPNLPAVFLDFQKYSYEPVYSLNRVDNQSLEWIVVVMTEMFSSALVEEDLSPWPLQQALDAMNGNTSPGYPWNLSFKTKDEWRKSRLDFRAILTEYLRTSVCFWNVSFKEEVRPLAKLEQNRARSFMSGPVEENLACLIFFGSLLNVVVENWRLLPITYGINMRARGWDFLIRRFKLRKAWAIDFSRFDGSLSPILFWIVYLILIRLIPDGKTPYGCTVHQAILSILKSHVASPCVFPDGFVCWKYTGNPSGSGLTIFVNSMIQLILVLLYLHVVHGVTSFEEVESFEKQAHGDDGRYGANYEDLGKLDFNDMNCFWQGQGLTIQVTTDNEEPVPVQELAFLSHVSVNYDGIWVPAPAEPEKLIASAELRVDNNTPDDWDPDAYELARLAQIANELVFCGELFDAMQRVVLRFIEDRERQRPTLRHNISWINAQKHIKRKRDIVASYTSDLPLRYEASPDALEH